MKKTKKLSILAAVALSACACMTAVACEEAEDHTHEYASWSVTTKPSLTEGGVITGTCAADGETTTVDVPELNDTDFWTPSTHQPTHVDAGYTLYTSSEYGVSVRIDGDPALGHSWGSWSVKADAKPTAVGAGKIVCTCTADDGGIQEKDVPNLADATFWTVQSYTESSKTSPGVKIFTNAAYSVTYRVDTPVLTDTSFWTAGELTPPGHTTKGSQTFTNATYALTVKVEPAATGHTWGNWTFVAGEEPDESRGGKITRVCSAEDGGVQTENVPELSDPTYWNRQDITADYNTAGFRVYTPKDTSIVIEKKIPTGVPKIPAPYDNKKYYALAYELEDVNLNKNDVGVISSWDHASITLGGENYNVGLGNAYPFQNKTTKIEMDDPETGKVKISMSQSGAAVEEYVGYVNMTEDGVPLIVYKDGSRYIVLTEKTENLVIKDGVDEEHPEGTGSHIEVVAHSKFTKASSWTFNDGVGKSKALAVKYKYGDGETDVLNFYLEENALGSFRVYFEAGFNKKNGTAVSAETLFASQDAVYITDAAGNAVRSFGYKNNTMRTLDGLENTYTGTIHTYASQEQFYDPASPITIENATAVLDGMGGIAVSYTVAIPDAGNVSVEDSGHYVVLDGGKLGIYIGGAYDDETGEYTGGGEYYETTSTTETTFECQLYIVTLTGHDVDGEGNVVSYNVCKNIAIPVGGKDLSSGMMGAFYDAGFTQEVPEDLIPTENVDIYFRWSTNYITFVTDDGSNTDNSHRVYFIEGMTVEELIPRNIQTITETHYIVGWFTAAVGGDQVSRTDVVSDGDSETKLYAHWAEIPAYVGTYSGKQLLSGDTTYAANITINVFGEIEGSLFTGRNNEIAVTGTVKSFADGVITYTASNGSTGFMWFDDGLLVLPKDLSNNQIDTYPFVLSNNSVQMSDNSALGINVNKTYLVAMADATVALIHNDRVYNAVTVEDAFGVSKSTLADALDSKTIVVKNKTGAVVLAVGTTAEKYTDAKDELDAAAEKKLLDGVYGVYTCGGTTVKLDGMGKLTSSEWEGMEIGEKTAYFEYVVEDPTTLGVYVYVIGTRPAQSSGSSGTGDWYGDEDYDDDDEETTAIVKFKSYKEYWRISGLNVDENTIESIRKIEASLTYNVNKKADASGMDDITDTTLDNININIPYMLTANPFIPDEDDNYIFDGWYADAECTGEALTYVTLDGNKEVFAKWIVKRTLTFNYNFTGVTETIDPVYIGDGKVVALEDPKSDGISDLEGYSFIDWYTDAACTIRWDDTKPVTADQELFARWGAPAYNRSYAHVQSGDKATGGKTGYRNSGTVSFDAKGNSTNTGFPFNTESHKISDYDEAAGTFTFTSNSSNNSITRGDHDGFIDVSTGMIVIGEALSGNDIKDVYLLIPVSSTSEISNYGESRWDGGSSRAFTFTYGGNDHGVFVHNNNVYFDVTFEDGEGNAVSGVDACNQLTLVVKKDGDEIARLNPAVGLTVVYGNGLASEVKAVYPGVTFNMNAYLPSTTYKDGKRFVGWYDDEACTTPFTLTSITEADTVYAKWVESIYGTTTTVSREEASHWSIIDNGFKSGGYDYGATTNLFVTCYQAGHFEFDVSVSSGSYNYAYLKVKKNDVDITEQLFGSSQKYNATVASVAITLAVNDVLKFEWYTSSYSYRSSYVQLNNFEAEALVPVSLTYDYNGQGTASDTENYTSYDTVDTLKTVNFKYGTKVFAGWFTKNGESGDWGEELVAGATITENTTVYAKWLEGVTLKVIYANCPSSDVISQMKEVNIEYPTGWTIDPEVPPVTDGMAFKHWSESPNGDPIDWTEIDGNKTIYAVWMEAVSTYGVYKGTSATSTYNTGSIDASAYTTLTIAADGAVTSNVNALNNKTLDVSTYADVKDGPIVIDGRYFYFNSEIGLLWGGNNSNATSTGNGFYLLFDTTKVKSVSYSARKGGTSSSMVVGTSSHVLWATLTLKNDTTVNVFGLDSVLYIGVSFVGDDGAVSASSAYDATHIIKNKDGDPIVKFVKTSSYSLQLCDTYNADYFDGGEDSNPMTLDGFGKIDSITNDEYDLVGAIGSYAVAAADAGYTFDAVINGDNYELTVDKTNKTYSINKPMVMITYVTDLGGMTEQEKTVSVNLNKPYGLPALTDATLTLIGWYYDAAYTLPVRLTGGLFTPVEDDILYAKWDTANLMFGTWTGNNIDPSGAGIKTDAGAMSNSYAMEVDALGGTTGWKNANVVFVDASTSKFNLVSSATESRQGSCDADAGVAYIDFQSNKTGPWNDINLYVKTVGGVSMQSARAIAWDEGKSKLIEITMSDGSKKYALIYNATIYGVDSEFADKDGNEITFDSMYSSTSSIETLKITKSKDGSVSQTWTFEKVDSNLTLKS